MSAPNLTYSVTGNKLSSVSGFDSITVSFKADAPYQAFECRATKSGEEWGLGKGVLVASFSQTPADTQRQFELYDDFLIRGDGKYRITLFVQGADGSWNDNSAYVPAGASGLRTADGKIFMCRR